MSVHEGDVTLRASGPGAAGDTPAVALPRPRGVSTAFRLARTTRRIVRQNLTRAIGYNVTALPLATLGWRNPLVASAAMAVSFVLVVSNSLRLRRFAATPPSGDRKVVLPTPSGSPPRR